ncbi:MAG: GTPase HflX [Thermofilum sp.]
MSRRVLLVQRLDDDERYMLRELRELAEAAGYEVVGEVVQRREPDPRYGVGSGKVEEIRRLVAETGAERVIFYNFLKPNQVYNLRKKLGIEVLDRFELILEIFAKRAGSREAKLQIELARLKRELSFAREYINLQKRGELHGFLGGGRYAADAYYEYVVSRIAKIEEELRAIRRSKSMRWSRRGEVGIFSVALTGYTGAGKTTLFNRLAGWEGYVDGRPFATLSTKTRLVALKGLPLLLSDTIGFIDSLPEQLFDAFYTTIGEVSYSDLLLLVVDVAEPPREVERKVLAGLSILSALGVPQSRVLVAANKVDVAEPAQLESNLRLLRKLSFPEIVPISAKTGFNLRALEEAIRRHLPGRVKASLKVRKEVLGLLLEEASQACRVMGVEECGDEVIVELEGRDACIARLARKYGLKPQPSALLALREEAV